MLLTAPNLVRRILHLTTRHRYLVLVPTQELVEQTSKVFSGIMGHNERVHMVLPSGMSAAERKAELEKNQPAVLITTPQRMTSLLQVSFK